MLDEVDVILLRRDATDPPGPVRRGLASQAGVSLRVHRVVGSARPDDPNRWATIARARNAGKALGSAPWVLFLDDDVILGPGCVARLVEGLKARSDFAALAADYAGEMARSDLPPDGRFHITMGATLFRRDRLAPLSFRWSPGRCECRCACDDLHRAGFGIGYLPGAEAHHSPELRQVSMSSRPPPGGPGRVLVAFDRNHEPRFRRQFLGSLRASGNAERVTAVGYGLYPSERNRLAMTPGVDVVSVPSNHVSPSKRRLRDFLAAIEGWPEETPVAYWDAGDALFQSRLAPLWDLVRAHPDRLLAVAEPRWYPENPAVLYWTRTIADPASRRRAIGLLTPNPWLNGGFAAGTVRAFRRYLAESSLYFETPALAGSLDWGDQTALNLYCHSHPERWLRVADGWNYCLHERTRGDYRVAPDGRVEALDGSPVHVAHGNAQKLRHTELAFLD